MFRKTAIWVFGLACVLPTGSAMATCPTYNGITYDKGYCDVHADYWTDLNWWNLGPYALVVPDGRQYDVNSVWARVKSDTTYNSGSFTAYHFELDAGPGTTGFYRGISGGIVNQGSGPAKGINATVFGGGNADYHPGTDAGAGVIAGVTGTVIRGPNTPLAYSFQAVIGAVPTAPPPAPQYVNATTVALEIDGLGSENAPLPAKLGSGINLASTVKVTDAGFQMVSYGAGSGYFLKLKNQAETQVIYDVDAYGKMGSALSGVASLGTGGEATISIPGLQWNDNVMLTYQGGTNPATIGILYVASMNTTASPPTVTIKSSSTTDRNSVGWLVVNRL